MMTKKADYTICSVPDHINVTCPHCDMDDDYNWDKLYTRMGNDLYFGNCGTIECSYCEKDIELGDYEYD